MSSPSARLVLLGGRSLQEDQPCVFSSGEVEFTILIGARGATTMSRDTGVSHGLGGRLEDAGGYEKVIGRQRPDAGKQMH